MTKKFAWVLAGVCVFAIAFYAVVVSWGGIVDGAKAFFDAIYPFVLGAAFAFVLNIPMTFVERLLLKLTKGKYEKLARALSILLSLVFVIALIAGFVSIVLPQIVESIESLIPLVEPFLERSYAFIQVYLQDEHILNFIENLNVDIEAMIADAIEFINTNIPVFFGQTIAVASSIVSGVVTFVLALIFALYLLGRKELLQKQFLMLFRAFLSEKWYTRITDILALSNKVFKNFISGQCLECFISGIMFFIVLSVLGIPYPLLISVMIGFLSLIPIFGSFVACAIGAFLILIVSPIEALYFLIIFIVVQQVEGNLVYPKVVGESVGLPGIWVLAAVTVGGSLYGVLGMLVGIPLTTVLYSTVRSVTYKKLSRKGGN